jgi:hypothetical protein
MGGDAGGVGSERDERRIVFAVRRGEIFAADVLAAEAAQGIWAGAGREQLPGQISPVAGGGVEEEVASTEHSWSNWVEGFA